MANWLTRTNWGSAGFGGRQRGHGGVPKGVDPERKAGGFSDLPAQDGHGGYRFAADLIRLGKGQIPAIFEHNTVHPAFFQA